MTITIIPVATSTNTWGDLITRVNTLIAAASQNMVTVGGNPTTGNASIIGTLTVNTGVLTALTTNTLNFTTAVATGSVTTPLANATTVNSTTGDITTINANTLSVNTVSSFTGNVITSKNVISNAATIVALGANTLSVNTVSSFTTNVVTSNEIDSVTGDIATFTSANSTIAALTANTSTLNVANITTAVLTTGTAQAFTSNTVNANVTSGNTATFTTGTVVNLNANVASGNTLNFTTGTLTNLTVRAVTANTVNANVASGNTLNFTTGTLTNLNANVASGNTLNFTTATLTTGTAQTFTADTLNANVASGNTATFTTSNATTLNADVANIGILNVGEIPGFAPNTFSTNNFTSNTANISVLTVGTVVGFNPISITANTMFANTATANNLVVNANGNFGRMIASIAAITPTLYSSGATLTVGAGTNANNYLTLYSNGNALLANGGLSFGARYVATPSDINSHLLLHTAGYGFSVSTNSLNYNVGTSGAGHNFYANSVLIGTINVNGLTLPAGLTSNNATINNLTVANVSSFSANAITAESVTTPTGSITALTANTITAPNATITNADITTLLGKTTTTASTTARAPLNIPHGTAPTTPVNGDIWTTTAGLIYRINSVTRTAYDTGNMATISQAEIEAGTVTTVRAMTAQRIAQGVAANPSVTSKVSATEAQTFTDVQQGQARANIGADILTGFRNKIINGDFDIWQRGLSQTASGYGSDDRWRNINGGTTKTHSRQSFTAGQTDVPGNPRYFSRTTVTSVTGAANFSVKQQRIDNVISLSNKKITLTFYAKSNAARNIAVEFYQHYGIGGSTPDSYPQGLFALTTSWKKFTIVFDVPTVSGKTITDGSFTEINFWFDAGTDFASRASSLGQQSGTFDIAHVSVVEGDARLETDPFSTRPYQMEYILCQYYYQIINCSGRFYATGANQNFNCTVSWLAMRIKPTRTFILSEGSNAVSFNDMYPITNAGGRFELISGAAGDVYQVGNYYGLDAEL